MALALKVLRLVIYDIYMYVRETRLLTGNLWVGILAIKAW
jgi:hypothetical protein